MDHQFLRTDIKDISDFSDENLLLDLSKSRVIFRDS